MRIDGVVNPIHLVAHKLADYLATRCVYISTLFKASVDIAFERRVQLRARLSHLNGLFAICYQLAPLRANAE